VDVTRRPAVAYAKLLVQDDHPKCDHCVCAASVSNTGVGTLCPFHLANAFPDTTDCPHCRDRRTRMYPKRRRQ
jgi:hypothetical protein